ncbi:hypothetical protein KXV68_006281 [Aspergillus fumigatus]|nr:hypothetical protein KXX11_009119 [Aspergillus fumigatus]KAH1345276.1 hypothetical protein KXX14_004910 [Aspergillus fumigatus]KAH1349488.1 hypothetical protein KXX63_004570 [Aspergillus fumigatus]KAH1382094.1 hypothetical protein KXX49_005892 [Aspergillus fumigatus]KAH1448809.1 hypothetical protein KXX58_005737 [Aspergillus fumigatus]
MEETALALLAELPKTCDTIADAFNKNSRELKAARDELCNAQSELTILKGLLEILFNLLEKMWATVRTYQMGKDMKEAEVQGEGEPLGAVLDLAIMQLDLQSTKIDCDALRRENTFLRSLLHGTEAAADQCE